MSEERDTYVFMKLACSFPRVLYREVLLLHTVPYIIRQLLLSYMYVRFVLYDACLTCECVCSTGLACFLIVYVLFNCVLFLHVTCCVNVIFDKCLCVLQKWSFDQMFIDCAQLWALWV